MRGVKVAILGAPEVGKTSFVKQLIGEKFPAEYIPTSYLASSTFRSKMEDSMPVTLLDIAGKEGNNDRVYNVIHGSPLAIFVVDITAVQASIKSAKQCQSKLATLEKESRSLSQKITRILVINKIDLLPSKKVNLVAAMKAIGDEAETLDIKKIYYYSSKENALYDWDEDENSFSINEKSQHKGAEIIFTEEIARLAKKN